jgi:hypothetical protein
VAENLDAPNRDAATLMGNVSRSRSRRRQAGR